MALKSASIFYSFCPLMPSGCCYFL